MKVKAFLTAGRTVPEKIFHFNELLCYTGKIAGCEFSVKRVSREIRVKFSHVFHMNFTCVSCEFHIKL